MSNKLVNKSRPHTSPFLFDIYFHCGVFSDNFFSSFFGWTVSLSGLIFPPLEKGRLDLGLGRQCFYKDQTLGLGIGSIVIFIALFLTIKITNLRFLSCTSV